MSDLGALRRAFRDLPIARLATVAPGGAPHVAPVWFVWLEDAVYASPRLRSATWRNAERDPRVSLAIDRGREWLDLAGVVVSGRATVHVPEDPSVRGPMSAWHEKYRSMFAGHGFERFAEQVPDLGFVRVEPERVRSWDHGLSSGAARPTLRPEG